MVSTFLLGAVLSEVGVPRSLVGRPSKLIGAMLALTVASTLHLSSAVQGASIL